MYKYLFWILLGIILVTILHSWALEEIEYDIHKAELRNYENQEYHRKYPDNPHWVTNMGESYDDVKRLKSRRKWLNGEIFYSYKDITDYPKYGSEIIVDPEKIIYGSVIEDNEGRFWIRDEKNDRMLYYIIDNGVGKESIQKASKWSDHVYVIGREDGSELLGSHGLKISSIRYIDPRKEVK